MASTQRHTMHCALASCRENTHEGIHRKIQLILHGQDNARKKKKKKKKKKKGVVGKEKVEVNPHLAPVRWQRGRQPAGEAAHKPAATRVQRVSSLQATVGGLEGDTLRCQGLEGIRRDGRGLTGWPRDASTSDESNFDLSEAGRVAGGYEGGAGGCPRRTTVPQPIRGLRDTGVAPVAACSPSPAIILPLAAEVEAAGKGGGLSGSTQRVAEAILGQRDGAPWRRWAVLRPVVGLSFWAIS